jgi:phosphodiesterase/alkaline phosphatase D-like protein
VIWFETQLPVKAVVVIDGKRFEDKSEVWHHEITVTGLKANTDYKYTVQYGSQSQCYAFKTAPIPGSRKPFVFAFTSDCRQALGGGERNIYGTNAYVMKKMAALAYQSKAAFFQFTGDMVSGYKTNKEELSLQLINWSCAGQSRITWISIPQFFGKTNGLCR